MIPPPPLSTPFPTRRSSDLALHFKPDFDEACNKIGSALASRGLLEPAAIWFSRALQMNPRPTKYLDRKSTRLNSSHLGISYAVFCLKKKNIHIITICPSYTY